MKMKKYLILAICIVILTCVITGFILFSPRPIIEDASTSGIDIIIYNPYLNQEMDARVEITNYDENGILDCLSQYSEQRTLKSANSAHWIGDVELEVVLHTENGSKCIILGNDNYSYESYGKPKYKILDSDNLKSALLELMDSRVEG